MIYYLAQIISKPDSLPNTPATTTSLNRIMTIVFTTLGAVAFLLLVISGLRYVATQGEPQKTAEIRRQILYISVGLVIAVSADAIVTYVLRST